MTDFALFPATAKRILENAPPPLLDSAAKQAAQADWDNAQALPTFALICVGIVSVVSTQMSFGSGPGSYLGVLVFAICAIVMLTRLNQTHRDAFIKNEMANGMTQHEAQNLYDERFSD
jgi:hypothetical protein